MALVNVHEAKTHLSCLLERVKAGEEIIIAKGGVPYARMVAIEPHAPRTPGLLKGKVEDTFFDAQPDDELDAWER